LHSHDRHHPFRAVPHRRNRSKLLRFVRQRRGTSRCRSMALLVAVTRPDQRRVLAWDCEAVDNSGSY
jgi:hypothetical protein